MNNRPKIGSLGEKELAQLLTESFFKIGKDIEFSLDKVKIMLAEVYKFQGWMFVDTFSDAFSKYAAGELEDAETLKAHVSPRFISMLMKKYFKKCNENKQKKNTGKASPAILSPEEKYTLFVQFIKVNQCLPGNSDWVSIYEHLTGLKKLFLPDEWNTQTFYSKWKYSRNAVTEWAYNCFTITEVLLFNESADGVKLRGIGTRLGETLR